MRNMPAHEYRGYTVVINPAGTPDGAFRNAYSIHAGSDNLHPLGVTVVEQRSISSSDIFDSESDAYESAYLLAHAWIDANPLKA